MDLNEWNRLISSKVASDRSHAADDIPDDISDDKLDGVVLRLLKCLEDPDALVRTCAADTLGMFPETRVRNRLRRSLKAETDPMAKSYIISSLGAVGDIADLTTLIEILKATRSKQMRQHTALGLFFCMQRLVLEKMLLPDLDDGDSTNRRRAANQIVEIFGSMERWQVEIKDGLQRRLENEPDLGVSQGIRSLIDSIEQKVKVR